MKLLNSLRNLFKTTSPRSTRPTHQVVPDVIFDGTANTAVNDPTVIHVQSEEDYFLAPMEPDWDKLPVTPAVLNPSTQSDDFQQQFRQLVPSEEFFNSTIHAVANDHTGMHQTKTDNASVARQKSSRDDLSANALNHFNEPGNDIQQSFGLLEPFELLDLFEPFEHTDEFFDRVVDAVANAPIDIYSTCTDNTFEERMESGRDELPAPAAQLPRTPVNALQQPQEQRQLTDKIFELPKELDELLKEVDIQSPPGLAGDFCAELARFETRSLAEPRIVAALNALALVRAKQGLYKNMKSSFFSIVAALSASGKEAHQNFQELLFNALSLNEVIVRKATSGKQLHEALIEVETPVFIVDECHDIFKSAAANTDFGRLDTIMLMLTAKTAKIPFKARREQIDALSSRINKLQNDTSLEDDDQKMCARLVRSFEKLKANHWPNPYFSFVGYSTPINTDFIVNTQNIDSGLMGRPIFMRVAEYRDFLNLNNDLDEPTDTLVQRFKVCLEKQEPITMSSEAERLVEEFIQFFEDNRNHRKFGAIYARGSEHLIRVSSLLAAETLVITEIEVLYAAKLFLNSLASLQAVESGTDMNFLFQSALETIKKHAFGKELTVGVLVNKLTSSNQHIRAYKTQDPKIAHKMVQRAIEESFLIVNGQHVQLVDVH